MNKVSFPLLSVIVPCYNVGKYLHRLMDSILMQSYPNVEIICVDDGSSDNTRHVLETYILPFRRKGYKFQIVSQTNLGVCEAINTGLQHVKGKYLVWPDGDDWYKDKDVLADAVRALEEDSTCSSVRFRPQLVDEATEECHDVIWTGNGNNRIFEDVLYSTSNIWLPAGSHVVRISTLFDYYKNRRIYASRYVGQNIQLLLPCCYHGLSPVLGGGIRYCILERRGSSSRKRLSLYRTIIKFVESSRMICATLDSIYDMDYSEEKEYKRKTRTNYYSLINAAVISSLRTVLRYAYKRTVGHLLQNV